MGTVSFFNRLDNSYKSALRKDNFTLLSFISEVKDWIKECHFTRYKAAREVLSQWGLPDTKAAENLNMTAGNIRYVRSTLSRELFALFGNDFCNYLDNGSNESYKDAVKIFTLVKWNVKPFDFFPMEYLHIIESLPTEKSKEFFNAKDCRKEYEFLRSYSISSFKKKIESLDKNKLAYVLKVLKRESGSVLDTYIYVLGLKMLETDSNITDNKESVGQNISEIKEV